MRAAGQPGRGAYPEGSPRNMRLSILPVPLTGSSPRNTTSRGTLQAARFFLHIAMISSSLILPAYFFRGSGHRKFWEATPRFATGEDAAPVQRRISSFICALLNASPA